MLFSDQQFTIPLLNMKKITLKAVVSDLGLKNGSIIYVKLNKNNQEQVQQQTTQLKDMSLDELDELISHPEVCPQCTHDKNVHCAKCINWWKEKCLKETQVSNLQYQNWKLNKESQQQKQSSLHSNIHNYSDIQKDTIMQLRITEEKEENLPINKIKISQYTYNILAEYFTRTNYKVESQWLSFGKINDNKEAIIYFALPLYFINLFETGVTQHDKIYQDIYNIIQDTIKNVYDWDLIGIISINKQKVFNSQQILYNMKKHCRMFILIQLCNHEYVQQKLQEMKNKQQNENQSTIHLTVQNEYNDQITIGYVINNQLQFLYDNKQINQEKSSISQFKFNKQQIINNQFMDQLDTDIFMYPLGQPQVLYQEDSQIYLSYADIFDIIQKFDKNLQIENQIIKNQRSDQQNNFYNKIVYVIQKYGSKVIRDPMFIIYFKLAGGRCDSLDTMKQNVKDYISRN